MQERARASPVPQPQTSRTSFFVGFTIPFVPVNLFLVFLELLGLLPPLTPLAALASLALDAALAIPASLPTSLTCVTSAASASALEDLTGKKLEMIHTIDK